MLKLLASNARVRIWKEMVVAHGNVVSRHCSRVNEESRDHPLCQDSRLYAKIRTRDLPSAHSTEILSPGTAVLYIYIYIYCGVYTHPFLSGD
jgi:hypothetical protein